MWHLECENNRHYYSLLGVGGWQMRRDLFIDMHARKCANKAQSAAAGANKHSERIVAGQYLAARRVAGVAQRKPSFARPAC